MRKTNLQVRISAVIDSQIERLAPASKSDFVRQAIEEKIKRETFRRLEDQWIQSLKKTPGDGGEDKAESEAWLKAESWDRR